MALISVEGCRKGFGDRELLRGVSLAIGERERVGLVGPNGCGKSTLLRILAGLEAPDAGTRVVRRGLAVGHLEQEPVLDLACTAREVVREGLAARAGVLAELERLHADLAQAGEQRVTSLLARQAGLEQSLERLGGHDVEHRVEATLQALGLTAFDAACGMLSGGERRRVALARLLLQAPDVLLLDEPTNHLDALVTDWLESWFLETRTPLLVVTHDRYVLDRVVDRIVELDRGLLFESEGGYAEYLAARAARLSSEGRAEQARLGLLRREAAWMHRGPPARTTKARARIHRYEALAAGAPLEGPAELELAIPPGPRLGTRVVTLAGVAKRFAGRPVLPPLDLELAAGERLGVVGPNGAGKTTLLRLILGQLEPDLGTRVVGETVRFMGIDQERSDLDPARTVVEEVAGRGDVVRTDERTVRVQGFLCRFGFPPARQTTRIADLSGGERSRVLLAKLLCAGGNVLVLDEPTNDLDLATLRALEEALIAFPGAVVCVSHDRWFLDRVATRILHLDGRGGARIHHGDVSSLLAELAAEGKEDAAKAGGKSPARPADGTAAGPPAAQAPPRPGRARRIAPWEQKELDELEGHIAALEAELAELDRRLSDPALYQGPRAELERLQARRAELDLLLAQRYERWETLEALRSGG
jgi:ABC transport system ATP-binding/permease protein